MILVLCDLPAIVPSSTRGVHGVSIHITSCGAGSRSSYDEYRDVAVLRAFDPDIWLGGTTPWAPRFILKICYILRYIFHT